MIRFSKEIAATAATRARPPWCRLRPPPALRALLDPEVLELLQPEATRSTTARMSKSSLWRLQQVPRAPRLQGLVWDLRERPCPRWSKVAGSELWATFFWKAWLFFLIDNEKAKDAYGSKWMAAARLRFFKDVRHFLEKKVRYIFNLAIFSPVSPLHQNFHISFKNKCIEIIYNPGHIW